jgi:alanyl-tRNA synthetase
VTQRLYLDDPELLRFDAQVTALRTLGGRPAAVLDRTAFYPEGGGQPADRGVLGEVAVLDVQEVDGEIQHVLAGELARARSGARWMRGGGAITCSSTTASTSSRPPSR